MLLANRVDLGSFFCFSHRVYPLPFSSKLSTFIIPSIYFTSSIYFTTSIYFTPQDFDEVPNMVVPISSIPGNILTLAVTWAETYAESFEVV